LGVYTQFGPFSDGSSPAISSAFLNGVESAIKNGGMSYFLSSPYHMFTNPTLNSGTTRTDTYTGGTTGVPSGALAVYLGIGIFANTANGYLQIYPAGGTAGQGPGITGVGTAYTVGSCVCPVNGSGQITLKANSSNIVLQDWYIYGYII
jgi:hypothetical protein